MSAEGPAIIIYHGRGEFELLEEFEEQWLAARRGTDGIDGHRRRKRLQLMAWEGSCAHRFLKSNEPNLRRVISAAFEKF